MRRLTYRTIRSSVSLVQVILALTVWGGRAGAQTSPHGAIRFACEDCHTAESWSIMPSPPKFRHERTGFPLTGQHSVVECTGCHASLTFAIATKRCMDCHDDVHRNELGASCERCHTSQSWLVPDMVDRHRTTRFPLVGAHRFANCRQCHVNQQLQEFVGLRTDCVGCHRADYDATKQPVHRTAGFGLDCQTCHAVSAMSWGGEFNHATTGFPLTGAHAAAACASCHKNNVFQGASAECYSCHAPDFTSAANPPHTGFATACVQCHTTSAWHPASFNHSTTGFALTGAHATVACTDCHKNGVFTGTATACYACHQAQFTGAVNPPHAGFPTDCVTCHTTASWKPASFDHSKSQFPLTGAHATVACSGCHKNNVYAGLPTDCASCHAADFSGATNPPHTGFPMTCATCHTTTAWSPASFNHATTAFPLTGAHAAVACAGCHKNNVYAGLPTDCASCHAADFSGATNPPHTGFPMTCATCHTTTAWSPATFNHATTSFPLTGAHTSVACTQCHVNNVYKGTPATCGASGCHLADYNATNPLHSSGGFGTDCKTCHTTTAWSPNTWALSNHATWFRISSGNKHNPTVWANNCATCHMTSSYQDFSCIDCHTHNQTTTNQQHQGRANYQYNSAACYSCHKNV
jgi:hypothetical protein